MDEKRASESKFNQLHRIVTDAYIERVLSGEATVQDLKAAAEWCIKNDVNAPMIEGGRMDNLRSILPKIDMETVQRQVNR